MALAAVLCGALTGVAKANIAAPGSPTGDGRCLVLPEAYQRFNVRAGGPVAPRIYPLLAVRVVFAGETGNPVGTVFGETGLGEDEVRTVMLQVDDFFYENSAGLVQFAPTFTGVLTLPKTKAAYGNDYTLLVGDAKLAAKAAGFDPEGFDFTVIFAPLAEFPYGGVSGGEWIHINGAFTANLVAHELGHSFGMGHSGTWASNTSDPIGASGSRNEYGNPFDPMGNGHDAPQHFSAIWKERAGWWPDEAVTRATTTGTTRVYRYDHFQADGVRALVVPAGNGIEYWVSVARNQSADDFEIHAAPRDGVLIQRLDTLRPGLEVPELIRPMFEAAENTDFLDARFVPGMSVVDAANGVKITVVEIGGTSPDEWADVKVERDYVPGLGFTLAPGDATIAAGATLTLRAVTDVAATYQWRFNGTPLAGETGATLTIANAQVSRSGGYTVDATAGGATLRSREASVVVTDAPVITFASADQAVPEIESNFATYHGFRTVGRRPTTGRWRRDGVEVFRATWQTNGAYSGMWVEDGETNGNLTFFDSQVSLGWMTPGQAGFYAYAETNAAGAVESIPLTIGLRTHKKFVGDVVEVGSDIFHPNGNVYDQLLLTGRAATFRADAGQVTRCSFIDLNDDIVQVEFSGRGNLTIRLDAFSEPARPVRYRQDVDYVKGHATIVIVGADRTTNVSVFSVGRANAFDQSLFPEGQAYDGVADIQAIGVQSLTGEFGGIYAANTEFWGVQGWTGINATRVTFLGPVRIGNLSAREAAEPMLRMEERADDVQVAGGDLWQENGKAIHLDGGISLLGTHGTTSGGEARPAQVLRGTYRYDRR